MHSCPLIRQNETRGSGKFYIYRPVPDWDTGVVRTLFRLEPLKAQYFPPVAVGRELLQAFRTMCA